MKQYIRKADIILLIILVALGLAASAALAMQRGSDGGAKVVIKSGGSLYAAYSLSEDISINVPAPKQINTDGPMPDPDAEPSAQYDYYNVVKIEGGKVIVSEASCHNQVCVHHAAISHPGESIICLPNRLVVSIEGDEGGEYDSITS